MGGVVAIGAIGLLLISRRATGAIVSDLPLPHLILAAVVVGAVVLGGRAIWRWGALSRERQEPQLAAAFGWSGSAAVVLMAIGCSLERGWDWLVWLPLIGVEQWQLRWFLREIGARQPVVRDVRKTGDAISQRKTDHAIAGFMELQRVLRVREEGGAEAVHARLVAEFATGQRQATLHVAFCPPLERVPVIEMEVVDGPEAELKAGAAYCHGARVEVRLGEPAEEECAVVVEMVAKPQAAEELREEIGRG
jgi:hypothetical protein